MAFEDIHAEAFEVEAARYLTTLRVGEERFIVETVWDPMNRETVVYRAEPPQHLLDPEEEELEADLLAAAYEIEAQFGHLQDEATRGLERQAVEWFNQEFHGGA